MRRKILLSCVLFLCGCGRYVPPRFAERAPVTAIDDDAPIAVPEPTNFVESRYLSDVYLRRPIVDALDVARIPYAADVNALDEVPRSSFYDPRAIAIGPAPLPPFTVEQTRGHGDDASLSVQDASGRRFVLRHDPAGLPQTRSAAAVIASRLARNLGYRTVPVWALDVGQSTLRIGPIDDPRQAPAIERGIDAFMDKYERRRVSATAWPIGLDLGPTTMNRTRDDDPNDRIDHRDRRSVRALQVLLAWLDLDDIGPERARDIYVGHAGRGHVDHVLVWLDGALGVHRLLRGVPVERAVGVVRGAALTNLATLGLYRGGPRRANASARSLVVLGKRPDPEVRPSRPTEPFSRLQAPDGYWAAKHLASLPAATIPSAVKAGHVDDPAVAEHVVAALEARRRALTAYWMARVTPCEVAGVTGHRLVIEDRSVALGLASSKRSRYIVGVLDDDGTPIGRLAARRLAGARFAVDVPKGLLARRGYLVLRITAIRDGKPLPRAFELHVVPRRDSLAVIGVRH